MKAPVGRWIAGAFLLACLAPRFAAAQEIGLRRPVIGAVAIRPDTVWFCGTTLGTDRASYYFVRATRAWGQATVPQAAPCSDAGMWAAAGDSIHDAGRGVRVVRVSGASGRSYLRVVDSARGQTTEPLRRLDPAIFAQLPRSGDFEADSVSTGVGGTAIDDSTIWIGLRGGFPEGEGVYGGLLRIDRRSGAVSWIHDSLIVDREITGIADAGRSLLVAAVIDGEYGRGPEPGLLRFDKTNRTLRRYGEVPLPDSVICLMVGDGRLVAFATEHGLAVAALGADGLLAQWGSTWFVPGLAGDSMVYGLGPKERAPESLAAQAPWIFAQQYAPAGHERFFHDALLALPPSRAVAAVFGPGDSVVAALADTSLTPLLTRMLNDQRSQRIAALALARLGVRSAPGIADSLRRQFLAGGYNRPALAKALLAAGDSMPRDWARAKLDTAVRAGIPRDRSIDVTNAIMILSELRDRPSMGGVIAIASTADASSSNFLTARLAAFDDPIAWGAMLSLERAGKLRAFDVSMFLQPSALGDSVVHERVREFLRRQLPVDSLRQMALLAVDRLRMIELAPGIIDRMAVPIRPGLQAGFNEARTLVSLSGRSDAPIWTGTVPPPDVHDWWQRWWASTNGRAVAVSTPVGRKAGGEWMKRFFAARPR